MSDVLYYCLSRRDRSLYIQLYKNGHLGILTCLVQLSESVAIMVVKHALRANDALALVAEELYFLTRVLKAAAFFAWLANAGLGQEMQFHFFFLRVVPFRGHRLLSL